MIEINEREKGHVRALEKKILLWQTRHKALLDYCHELEVLADPRNALPEAVPIVSIKGNKRLYWPDYPPQKRRIVAIFTKPH